MGKRNFLGGIVWGGRMTRTHFFGGIMEAQNEQ